MDQTLGLLGLLFLMFMILASAVEVILEVFRGVLERAGLSWPKGKVSLEDALTLAKEFAPDNKDLNAKLESIRAVAGQVRDKVAGELLALERVATSLGTATGRPELLAAELNRVAGVVKAQLAESERTRIFILRTIAAVVGCFLVYWSDFYVFRILAQDQNARAIAGSLKGLQGDAVNILVGGLAAAAGSSYWHDMLDKVRALKVASESMKKL